MPTRISYDGMSRLTAAGYLENGKRNDHFSTSYKYDLMGNILSLRREGLLNSGNYGTIDDLTYSYKGNQVVKIDDAAEESPSYRGAMHFRDYADEETEYTYDANGNMLTDSNKGITSIDYNVLDLPQCISTKSRALFKEDSNDTIYYTYSADGTKLRSTYKKAEYRVYPYNPETSLTSFNVETGLNVGTVGMAKPIAKRLKTKYYYCSNLVYDNDNISAILFDGGYASVDDDNGIVMHFYVKDHLGSNRLVVDGNGNIEEVNHYYPFGALMGDRCGVSRNNYKYIGKELDTMYGWNMQDHEARWYDIENITWRVIDAKSEINYSISPYAYVDCNPIKYIDTDGKIKRNYFLPLKEKENDETIDPNVISHAFYKAFQDGGNNVINLFLHGFTNAMGFMNKDKNITTCDQFYELIKNDKELLRVFEAKKENGLYIVLYMCRTANFAKTISLDPRFKNVTIIAPNGDFKVWAYRYNNKGDNVSDYEGVNMFTKIDSPIVPENLRGVWKAYKNGKNIANYKNSSLPGSYDFDYKMNRPLKMIDGRKYK